MVWRAKPIPEPRYKHAASHCGPTPARNSLAKGTLIAKRNAAIKALAIPLLDWDGNIPEPW
jgi:hypothetical protein